MDILLKSKLGYKIYENIFVIFIDHVQKNENKTKRLRNNLRELEELLMTTNATNTDGNLSVVWSAWRSSILLQLMFSNGLIANLMLDKLGNLEKITFDKVIVIVIASSLNYRTKSLILIR